MSVLAGSLRLFLPALLLATAGIAGPGAARAEDLFDPPPAPALLEMRVGSEASDPAEGAGGNPVRAVPLARLAATRARPLFTPSRRPPSPPPKAPPPVAVPPAPAAAAAPPRPRITLVGTVVGAGDAYSIFQVETTGSVVRLRIGESIDGWVLRSARRRDAELEKDNGREVLTLSARGPAGANAAPRPSPPERSKPPAAAAHAVPPPQPQPQPARPDTKPRR